MDKNANIANDQAGATNLQRTNRLTLEFLILAGILGIGGPVAVLLGAQAGERTAAVIYTHPDADQ